MRDEQKDKQNINKMDVKNISLNIIEVCNEGLKEKNFIDFEMDVIIQMIHLFPVKSLKGIAVDIRSTVINSGTESGQNEIVECRIPVYYTDAFIEEIRRIESVPDMLIRASKYESLITKYTIRTYNTTTFNSMWKGNSYVTCSIVFELERQAPVLVGPFKLIDLVRDFKNKEKAFLQ